MPERPVVHELFPDLEAMLRPAVLAEIDGRPVGEVAITPFKTSDSLSGSQFLAVELDGDPARRYVVKRLSHERDWLMRATGDLHGRAALAWELGLLDLAPPEIDHTVVACSLDEAGAGRAILMRDVSDALIPPGDEPLDLAGARILLDAMASLHAAFWGQAELAAPKLGFIDPWHFYHSLSPETGRREAAGADAIPKMVAAGWALLDELLAPDVATIVSPLLEDPTPLVDALATYRVTVVHSDWKFGNLGLQRPPGRAPRVVLLDWDRVMAAQPAADLGWYLAVNSARLPQSKEETVAEYRRRLEMWLGRPLDDVWWQAQLELSLLGAFLQLGWPKLLGAGGNDPVTRERERAELEWWSGWVRAGSRRLG